MDNLIVFGAKYLIFMVVLIVLAVWLQIDPKKRAQFASAIVLAAITAVILSQLAGKFYFHHRPFIVQNIQPLIPHGDDNGFPSDHTLITSTLAAVVYFYRRQLAIALFGLAAIVGISRVLAHIHWTIDIIGGLVLGVLAGWSSYLLAKKLLPDSQNPTPTLKAASKQSK